MRLAHVLFSFIYCMAREFMTVKQETLQNEQVDLEDELAFFRRAI